MGSHPTLLVTGASGLVGAALCRAAFAKWRVIAVGHSRRAPALRRGDRAEACDLTAAGAVESLVAAVEPQAIVHLAALASLPACERDPERAQRLNVGVTERLARAAARDGIHLVHLSTDQVFAGDRAWDDRRVPGYLEDDEPRPLHAYGRTKVAAESAVRASGADALVVRTALVLAPSADGKAGALDFVRGAAPGAEVRLFTDEWRTPISVLDLGRMLDVVLAERRTGTLHAAGPDRVDRLTLGRAIDAAFPVARDAPPRRLVAASQSELPGSRPRDVSLASRSSTGRPVPRSLSDALTELCAAAPDGPLSPPS
jgi:dTDP-4-dehydrorhamnose reductase